MLGKVITLSKTARAGFGPVVRYVFRDDRAPAHGVAVLEGGTMNLQADHDTPEDRRLLAELLDTTARRAPRFRGNPVYHLALSWQAGEHPTPAQVRASVRQLMATLRMSDCEAVYALHRDTEHEHVHLLINRVHPEKGTVAGPPQYDYFLIDRACRELELAQGWAHDPGPQIVLTGADGTPTIVRRSAADRARLREHRGAPPSPRAQRAARNQGVPSFQEWVGQAPAEAVWQALISPDPTWTDVHRVLADYGVTLQPKGSGLVVTTTLPHGRRLAAKASQLGRVCSKAGLERRLGPFTAPALGAVVPAQDTYAAFVTRGQRGDAYGARNTGPIDPATLRNSEDPARTVRREARAAARQKLYDRFQTEQGALNAQRPHARKERTARHRQERADLQARLRTDRSVFLSAQTTRGVPRKVAVSLWAFEAAKAREGLQQRQKAERRQLGRGPRGQVWREWLTHEAERGDEAAQAAIRGIHYQEQRKRNRHRNGLEGEDLGPLQPVSVLSSLQAAVDSRRPWIHYCDAQGRIVFTDTGPRIQVHDTADTTLEAALRVAAQKYGGSLDITGSAAFREQAARTAARLGITVRDADLQPVWQQARQAMRAAVRTPEREEGMER